MQNSLTFQHYTVLESEMVEYLAINPGDAVVDCTLGGGGHTNRLLQKVGEQGLVIAIEQDKNAIEYCQKRFSQQLKTGNLKIVYNKFSNIKNVVESFSLSGKIKGVCADIGVSSPQLDLEDRGFSLAKEGPLDMRMDQSSSLTAKEVINTYDEEHLSKIFYGYGEEPKARHLAKKIVLRRQQKEFSSTTEFAEFIKNNINYKTKSIRHPALKVFQAIRIEVNKELDELQALIANSLSILSYKGRLGIISFHSLEDRIVKQTFLELAGRKNVENIPKGLPFTGEQVARMKNAKINVIKPFPIVANDQEIKENSRSRTAKLRVVEKIIH